MNEIPEMISRNGDPIEIAEMKNFFNYAIKERVNQYITEIFYDSKSNLCEVKLSELVVYGDPIYQKIHSLAKVTIKQFSILDQIDHSVFS
jgi:hypothetical protein